MKKSNAVFWNSAAMWIAWSKTLGRMWREKAVLNVGLHRNVKLIWNVSREKWKEAARSFEKITGTLRVSIDESIWRYLAHYLRTSKSVNSMGSLILLILPWVTNFGNIFMFSTNLLNKQNLSRYHSMQTRYIIIIFEAEYCLQILSSDIQTHQPVSN